MSITTVDPKNSDRGWKLCRCNECGLEAVCTPQQDFYIEEADQDKDMAPLYCWSCLLKRRNEKEPERLIKVTKEPSYEENLCPSN